MDELLKELASCSAEGLKDARRTAIEAGEDEIPDRETSANALAARLHPAVQHLKVAETEKIGNIVLYTLVPAEKDGSCAAFTAGQYLSFRLHIGTWNLTRAYSICSAPREALEGKYVIAVERVPGGLASEFIQDTWQAGTPVEASAPEGNFGYEPLRDAKHVIALAGGSGVTPFLSMAGAIRDGDEEFDLTILYGNRTMADAVFAEKLAGLEKASRGKVRVVHVLEKETLPGCEAGYITAEMIRKYAPMKPAAPVDGKYSVFLCGPRPMYLAMDRELPKLGIERKYIRRELFGETLDPHTMANCPELPKAAIHLTARIQGTEYQIEADPEMSLLRNLEKNGILILSRCRSGGCGCCRAHVVSGATWTPAVHDGRRMADEPYGWVHLCCTWAMGDAVIEV